MVPLRSWGRPVRTGSTLNLSPHRDLDRYSTILLINCALPLLLLRPYRTLSIWIYKSFRRIFCLVTPSSFTHCVRSAWTARWKLKGLNHPWNSPTRSWLLWGITLWWRTVLLQRPFLSGRESFTPSWLWCRQTVEMSGEELCCSLEQVKGGGGREDIRMEDVCEVHENIKKYDKEKVSVMTKAET